MKNINHDILIDTLIQFEMSMAQLYIKFGKIFHNERNEWTNFAAEEYQHARWITELKIYLKNEILSIEETRITIQEANQSIKFIELQLFRATNNNIDLREALIIALEIENAAIESSFLNIFSFKTQKAEKIRRKLVAETRTHREKFVLWFDRIESRTKMVA